MAQNFVDKLSGKERKFLYIALVVALLAVFDRLFMGPVLDKIGTLEKSIAEQQVSIKRDLRFLSYKDRIQKETKAFSKYFAGDVKDDDVVNADFLRTIEKLASQAHVTLIKSNPSQAKKEAKFSEYYASLDCSGELKDVVTFMHLVNSSDDLLKIVQFNMTPKRGTTSEVNVSMNILKLVITPDA